MAYVELLSWRMPGETEKIHINLILDIWNIGRDSNLTPLK
jgi:hypothetical protein